MKSLNQKSSVLWLLGLIILSGCNLTGSILVHNVYTLCGLISYILCLRNWLKSGNQLVSLYAIFVLYMMMSHIGQSLLYLFNMPANFLAVYSWCSFDSITEYLKYHMLCAAALNVGTVYCLSKPGSVLPNDLRIQSCREHGSECSGSFVWDVILIGCLFYVVYTAVHFLILRQSLDYADYFEQRSAGSFIKSLPRSISIVVGLWYVYTNRYRKFVYSIWAFCILAYMVGGSRGTAISYIGSMAISFPLIYPQLFAKRRMIYWIAGGVLAFSMLSVISANRSSSLGANSLSSTEGVLMNAAGSMSEMGGSAKTAVFSMEAIKSGQIPHWQTNLYFLLASVFPASLVQGLGLPDVELAGWVTEYAGSTWSGLGYSCVAESFVNYGWLGWIWFILYGWFISFAENYIHRGWASGKYLVPCLLAFYLCAQIFYARAEIYHSQSAARFCIYTYLLSLFFIKPSKR